MKTTIVSDMLYKRDTKGKVREWHAEVGTDGTRWGWRTIAGLQDGKKVTSEWTYVEQKNVGRSNETDLAHQAMLEMTSESQKKKDRGYFNTIENIDTFEKTKPMLAIKYEDAKLDMSKGCYTQPKLDGIRCIARKDGLWTRQGKEIVAAPHVMDALTTFFQNYPDAILDGELYNHVLRDDFNKITSLVRKTKPTDEDLAESKKLVQYHVYDVVQMPDKKPAKFSNRYNFICSLGYDGVIQVVETIFAVVQEQIDRNYGDYLQDGYEGQMIRLDAEYEQDKRSKTLIKRKEFLTDEFEVVEVLEGQGNWQGCVKHFVLKLNSEKNFQAGVRGTMDMLREMWNKQEKPDWVTLRYFTPTPDGVPRFPVVVDWGKEKRQD